MIVSKIVPPDARFFSEWQSLWEKSPQATYANSPEWFRVAVHTYGYESSEIIAGYKGDVLVIVLPLVREKMYGLSVYTTAGSFVLGIPLVSNDLSDHETRSFLQKSLRGKTIVFDDVTSEFARIMRKIFPWATTPTSGKAYIVDRSHPAALLVATRQQEKYRKRVGRSSDRVAIETYAGQTQRVNAGFAAVEQVDAASTKKLQGYSTFASLAHQQFFTSLIQAFASHVMIHVLWIGKEPVAYSLGFRIKETYYGNQTAFSAAYRRFAPGKYLLASICADESLTNCRIINFGSGGSSYKHDLSEVSIPLYKVIASPHPVLQMILLCCIVGRHQLYERISRNVWLYGLYRKSLWGIRTALQGGKL